MRKNKWLAMILVLAMIISIFMPYGLSTKASTTDNTQISYGLETVSEANEYTWWKFIAVDGFYKIQNVKSGYYLTNANGVIGLSETADTDNELWNYQNWYDASNHIYNKADGSFITLYNGDLSLLSGSECTHKGTEAIKAFDETGADVTKSVSDGMVVKICNHVNYGDGVPEYISVKETETGEGGGDTEEPGNTEDQKTYEVETVGEANEYTWWKFIAVDGFYKIQNVKNGYYLTNANGVIGLSETADTDNELWNYQDWYGASNHIYNKADGSFITLYNGELSLMSKDVCTHKGEEAIKAFDETGADVTKSVSDGMVVKICNHVNYGDGVPEYISVKETETGEGGGSTEDTEGGQKSYELETVGEANEYTWWKFIAVDGFYKIQNVKTGFYLTNVDGTLGLSETADTDNELWIYENWYNSSYHIYSKVDGSYITLYGGELSLLEKALCTHKGTEAIKFFDETDTDVSATLSDGMVVKICNHVDNVDKVPAYLSVKVVVLGESITDIPTVTRDPYSKITTYIADLVNGISNNDKNWDLLFKASVTNGKIVGEPSNESGIYGVAFRRRTSGSGTSELNFKLLIPDSTSEYVSIALRLNDYYDLEADKTGFRIYINKDGRVGLKFADETDITTFIETGYSFTAGRNIYIADNADSNIVTLYFDVDGTKIKIAEFAIERGTVVMTDAADSENVITKAYEYNIYYDGFMSVTTSGHGVEISELKTVIPTFSKIPFATDEEVEYILETSSVVHAGSWWKFIAVDGFYKIQNVETGYYLTNLEGTLALSPTADTDNELWEYENWYNSSYHIYSKADEACMTLYGGDLSLLERAFCSHEGTQAVRMFNETGTDVSAAVSDGLVVKICNHVDFVDEVPTYLTVTAIVYEEVTGSSDDNGGDTGDNNTEDNNTEGSNTENNGGNDNTGDNNTEGSNTENNGGNDNTGDNNTEDAGGNDNTGDDNTEDNNTEDNNTEDNNTEDVGGDDNSKDNNTEDNGDDKDVQNNGGGMSLFVPLAILGIGVLAAVLIVILALLKKRRDEE